MGLQALADTCASSALTHLICAGCLQHMSTKFADTTLLLETRQQALAAAASLLRSEDSVSTAALPCIIQGLEVSLADPQTDAATQAAAFDVLLQLTDKGRLLILFICYPWQPCPALSRAWKLAWQMHRQTLPLRPHPLMCLCSSWTLDQYCLPDPFFVSPHTCTCLLNCWSCLGLCLLIYESAIKWQLLGVGSLQYLLGLLCQISICKSNPGMK